MKVRESETAGGCTWDRVRENEFVCVCVHMWGKERVCLQRTTEKEEWKKWQEKEGVSKKSTRPCPQKQLTGWQACWDSQKQTYTGRAREPRREREGLREKLGKEKEAKWEQKKESFQSYSVKMLTSWTYRQYYNLAPKMQYKVFSVHFSIFRCHCLLSLCGNIDLYCMPAELLWLKAQLKTHTHGVKEKCRKWENERATKTKIERTNSERKT